MSSEGFDESSAPVDLNDQLVRVAGGDKEAFARIYDSVSALVHGLALRVLRNQARAEEVTQVVFLQVWQTAGRYDASRGSAKTWIMTLAHRRAVDAVRHDQAARDRENTYDWSGQDYDQVEEEVAMTIEREQVRRCLEGLTPLQREAIDLAYYRGQTYAEVAVSLDANPATVKTRMRDGLRRLRGCLGEGE